MRLQKKFQWNLEIAIIVAISKKEDSSLERLLFLKMLVNYNILVLSVLFALNYVFTTIRGAFEMRYISFIGLFCFKLSYTYYMQ